MALVVAVLVECGIAKSCWSHPPARRWLLFASTSIIRGRVKHLGRLAGHKYLHSKEIRIISDPLGVVEKQIRCGNDKPKGDKPGGDRPRGDKSGVTNERFSARITHEGLCFEP